MNTFTQLIGILSLFLYAQLAYAQQAAQTEEVEDEQKPPSTLLPEMPQVNNKVGNNPALNNLLVNEPTRTPTIEDEIEKDYRSRDPNDPNKMSEELKEKLREEKDKLRMINRRGSADNPRLKRLKRDDSNLDDDIQSERFARQIDPEMQEVLWHLLPVIYGEETGLPNEDCAPARAAQHNSPIPAVDRPNRYTTPKTKAVAPAVTAKPVVGADGRERHINYGNEAQYGRQKGLAKTREPAGEDISDMEIIEMLMKLKAMKAKQNAARPNQNQNNNNPQRNNVRDSVNDLFNDLQ